MKQSMVIYYSFYEAILDLPPKNQLEVFNAICKFGFTEEEPELTGISNTVFKLIRPQLEANNRKAAIGIANGSKGADYGHLGGRPAKEKPPRNPQETPIGGLAETPKKPSNVNDNNNDNDNVNNNDTLKKDATEFLTSLPDNIKNLAKKTGMNKLIIYQTLKADKQTCELSSMFIKAFYLDEIYRENVRRSYMLKEPILNEYIIKFGNYIQSTEKYLNMWDEKSIKNYFVNWMNTSIQYPTKPQSNEKR